MRHSTNQALVLYFMIAALAAITAVGQQPPAPAASAPDGRVAAISEWGLSGVVWSEAALVRKLAIETARSDDSLSGEQLERLQSIAEQSDSLIQAMEEFGWKRLRRRPEPSRDSDSPSGDSDSPSASADLPNPEAVGKRLAESMGLDADPDDAQTPSDTPQRRPRSVPESEEPIVSRYDTETPAGRDDPGVDDELQADALDIDIDQYRVDDYIDETPAEARNRIDAREDGVEGAIAAASDEGIGGASAGHISEREALTLSATLPYAQDSIYDADDYDPDIDYNVEHPLTPRKMRNPAGDTLDGDDDISVRDPAIAAEGEDELIAAMKREAAADRDDEMAVDRPLARYNDRPAEVAEDAHWVQFHLDLNQKRWEAAKGSGLSFDAVQQAAQKLKVTMRTIAAISDSERLTKLLR